jgi:5-formyltetrahydrofolate cyclo-ligase
MFTEVGVADEHTPVTAVVHDVQVVDERLDAGATDILVDAIATPTRYLTVERAGRPRGIRWDLIEPERLAATPPLQELKTLRGGSPEA